MLPRLFAIVALFSACTLEPTGSESFALDDEISIDTLVADLDAPTYRVRQTASLILFERCRQQTECRDELAVRLAGTVSAEARMRLGQVLRQSQRVVPWAQASNLVEEMILDHESTDELRAAQCAVAGAFSKSDIAFLANNSEQITELSTRRDFDFRRPPGRLPPPVFDIPDSGLADCYARRGMVLEDVLKRAGFEASVVGHRSDTILLRIDERSYGFFVATNGIAELYPAVPHELTPQRSEWRIADALPAHHSLPPLPVPADLPPLPVTLHAEWRLGMPVAINIRPATPLLQDRAPTVAAAYFSALYPGLRDQIHFECTPRPRPTEFGE